jgi:hypothetical protein
VDTVPQADTAFCHSLMMRSVYLGLVERMAVWIRCPKLILRSATADLSGSSRRICRWCSLNLVSYFLYKIQIPASRLFCLLLAFTLASC